MLMLVRQPPVSVKERDSNVNLKTFMGVILGVIFGCDLGVILGVISPPTDPLLNPIMLDRERARLVVY